jgi:hypothetical protein
MEVVMPVLSILLSLLSSSVFALTQFKTSIYDIDYASHPGEKHLVLLNSGHVAKLGVEKSFNQNRIHQAFRSGSEIEISLGEDNTIVDLKILDSNHTKSMERSSSLPLTNDQYVPTTVESMEKAKKYFRQARYNPKDSQCFNRAMVWSYEWWRRNSLRSQKILIYFTRSYIRRYNFEWWFHIAPYIHVMDDGQVVERVMDIKYSRTPLEFRQWTNIFMRNNAECKVILKFSDYADFPYTGDCYIQRTNMYTYQPADLQMNEAWGYTKDRFNMKEVRQAYLEAFDESI